MPLTTTMMHDVDVHGTSKRRLVTTEPEATQVTIALQR